MAEGICKVEYYGIDLPNEVGEGARLMTALKEGGINFIGMWGYPVGGGQAKVDLVPEDAAAFRKVAKKLKIAVGPKQIAFLVSGRDKPGAIAALLGTLAAAGVNVHAIQALSAGGKRYAALVQVQPEDVKKATKALTAR